jgi:hypothetical protein
MLFSQVERKIAEVMEAVCDSTRLQEEERGAEPRLTLSDDRPDSSARLKAHTIGQRESIGKSSKANRQLTIEEIRELS